MMVMAPSSSAGRVLSSAPGLNRGLIFTSNYGSTGNAGEREARTFIARGEMRGGERKKVRGLADADRSHRNAECRSSRTRRSHPGLAARAVTRDHLLVFLGRVFKRVGLFFQRMGRFFKGTGRFFTRPFRRGG